MPAAEPIRTIVVGADGSHGSQYAVRFAGRLAAGVGAEVVAVCGYSWNPMLGESTNQEIVDELRRQLEAEWVEPLATAGVPYRTMLEVGDARSILLGAGFVTGADLIVVGSRGRSQLAEMMLGSVAHFLTHHSTRPVVVVPAPPPDEEEGLESAAG